VPPRVVCDLEKGLAEALTPRGGAMAAGPRARRAEHGILPLGGGPQERPGEGRDRSYRQRPPGPSADQRGIPPSSRRNGGGGASAPADDQGVPSTGDAARERRLLEDGADAAPAERPRPGGGNPGPNAGAQAGVALQGTVLPNTAPARSGCTDSFGKNGRRVSGTHKPRTHNLFWRRKLYDHLSPLPHLGIEDTRLEARTGS
jgi:hypothetical protein